MSWSPGRAWETRFQVRRLRNKAHVLNRVSVPLIPTPIGGRQLKPFRSRAPQDGELLPQGKVFRLQFDRGFTAERKRLKNGEQKQTHAHRHQRT